MPHIERKSKEYHNIESLHLNLLIPIFGLLVLIIFIFLYIYHNSFYIFLLKIIMQIPYKSPFIDTQQIPAVLQCWQKGIDVYVTDPCDPLNRVFAYSPLWLRASFLPYHWRPWFGVILDGAFFGSLLLLPIPRRQRHVTVLLFAMLSGMPVFALERGNIDVVMFVLIAVGGRFWVQNFPTRLIAYCLFVLSGLLKFYPLVLFLLFLKERVVYCLLLSVTALVSLAGFICFFRTELNEMTTNLPQVPNFANGFGATQLPNGLGFTLQWLLNDFGVHAAILNTLPHSQPFAKGVYFFLIFTSASMAIWLARSTHMRTDFSALMPDERGYLVIGAALLCGCFFAGTSMDYRGIHFIFILPGILALSVTCATRCNRSLFSFTANSILFVMWWLTIEQFVVDLSGGWLFPIGGSIAAYVAWLTNELAWWWIMSVLLSVLLCFLLESPTIEWITARSNGREPGVRIR